MTEENPNCPSGVWQKREPYGKMSDYFGAAFDMGAGMMKGMVDQHGVGALVVSE